VPLITSIIRLAQTAKTPKDLNQPHKPQ